MPIDLFIYIVIAIVLVVWLRNTIGSKHGSETDRSDIIERIKERQQQNQNTADSGRMIDLGIPQNAETEPTSIRPVMDNI